MQLWVVGDAWVFGLLFSRGRGFEGDFVISDKERVLKWLCLGGVRVFR